VTGLEFASEQLVGEWVDHELLERTLERSRTVYRIVPSLGHPGDCLVGEVEAELALCEQLFEPLHLNPHDLSELGFAEWLEEDDLVDAIEQLGPELHRQLAHRQLLDLGAVLLCHAEQVLSARI